MKKSNYVCFLLFLWILLLQTASSALEKGIVVVPVADLVGQPLAELFPQHSASYTYNHLPWSCYRSHYAANVRLHQLLFHEQVTIIKTTKNEICIEIPNAYYMATHSSVTHARYWTARKNIMPLRSIAPNAHTLLAKPIDFRHPQTCNDQNVVSLLEPWHLPSWGITFSAGTRFIKAHSQPSKRCMNLYAFDPHSNTIKTIQIPQRILSCSATLSNQEKVQEFLRIMRHWIAKNPGIIGYVFGGCSYVQRHLQNIFSKKRSALTKEDLSLYERPLEPAVKTGFDCSGIILRAAQIAGLPYFFKNTHTIAQALRPLNHDESIEPGDLVWMPGHVMVVSDTDAHQIIEAHSYDGGYGRVHEMPIHKTFKGITTTADLARAFRTGAPLLRLDSKGAVQQTYTQFKILKLASIF